MAKKPSRRRDGPDEDRAWASYSAAFRQEVLPRLLSSAVFMATYDGNTGGDLEIKFATSLGLMLLYGKPIILAVQPGAEIPDKLRAIADEVVDFEPTDPASQDQVVAAFRRVMAGLDRETGGG